MNSKQLKNSIFQILSDEFSHAEGGISKREMIEAAKIGLSQSGELESAQFFLLEMTCSKLVDDFNKTNKQKPGPENSQLQLCGISFPNQITFFDKDGEFKRISAEHATVKHHGQHCQILKENYLACEQEWQKQSDLHLELLDAAENDLSKKIVDAIKLAKSKLRKQS